MITKNELSVRDRIIRQLEDKYQEYTYKKDFSLNDLGLSGNFMNVSLVIFKDNMPVLFIMIIGKTTPSHREYIATAEEIKKHNYKFIIFRKYLRVKDDYIADRLHYYL